MPAKNLVIYHYFEKDASYRDNFLHFLTFGIDPSHDYLVVVSGTCSVDLPQLSNVRYVMTEAKRSDFGGYAQVINDGLDTAAYEAVVFINSSVRGPFVPPYQTQSWLALFLAPLVGDVGMVGVSICTLREDFRHSTQYQARFGGQPPYSHVQTMAYALRTKVLDQLISDGFYQEDRDASKTLAIENYEIHLSQLVLAMGWNLRGLLPELNRIDYRLPHVNPNPSSTVGDPNEVLGYFGRSAHPYEVLFVKTNRHLFTEGYLDRLAYSMYQALPYVLPQVLLSNSSIQGYVEKIGASALSKKSVEDFSYLPGQIEDAAKLTKLTEEFAYTQAQLQNVLNSTSWKITAPLRRLIALLRK
jgi:hypothetical protein